jgi:O-antigen biosynthesis protein WbqV
MRLSRIITFFYLPKNAKWTFFNKTIIVSFLYDLGIAFFSFPLALMLHLGAGFLDYPQALLWHHVFVFGGITCGVLIWTESYKGVWRYISIHGMIRILWSVLLCTMLFFPCLVLTDRNILFSLATVVIQSLLLAASWGGTRLFLRAVYWWHQSRHRSKDYTQTALVMGLTPQTEFFLKNMILQKEYPFHVVGILDQSQRNHGRHLYGIEVLGSPNQFPEILTRLNSEGLKPKAIILANSPMASPDLIRFVKQVSRLNLKIYQMPVPQLTERESLLPTQHIDLLQVLGRPPVPLMQGSVTQLLYKKRVFVTGAGGTIGGELAHQIAHQRPDILYITDHNEYLLHQRQLELRERFPKVEIVSLLLDVRLRKSVFQCLKDAAPHMVFHAAALKHVPVVEKQPLEGILTNIIGTRNIADACSACGISSMVLVSTDKAINPSSLMGKTKRVAEIYCQAMDQLPRQQNRTRFATVRFGNVLGSSGSVIPLFQRQIERGGPLTVTHPDMTRYFMTVAEAAQLIIYALSLRLDMPESGRLFILDMGEPLSILEMAETMIRLSGLTPYQDINITFTGLREGEKIHEELFYSHEEVMQTKHPSIFLAAPESTRYIHINHHLQELEKAAWAGQKDSSLHILQKLVSPPRDKDSNIAIM